MLSSGSRIRQYNLCQMIWGVWMVRNFVENQSCMLALNHLVLYKPAVIFWSLFSERQEASVETWELKWCDPLSWCWWGLEQQHLNQLQLSDGLFREACEDTITIVESAEDKCMDKFFQILLRHESFYPWYIFKVLVGWLCNCLNVTVQIQVWVHHYTQISGLVYGF